MLRKEARGCAVGLGVVLDWPPVTKLMKTLLNRVNLYSIKGYCLVLMLLMMMGMMYWEHHCDASGQLVLGTRLKHLRMRMLYW